MISNLPDLNELDEIEQAPLKTLANTRKKSCRHKSAAFSMVRVAIWDFLKKLVIAMV